MRPDRFALVCGAASAAVTLLVVFVMARASSSLGALLARSFASGPLAIGVGLLVGGGAWLATARRGARRPHALGLGLALGFGAGMLFDGLVLLGDWSLGTAHVRVVACIVAPAVGLVVGGGAGWFVRRVRKA